MLTLYFAPLLFCASLVAGLAVEKRDLVDYYNPAAGNGTMFSDAQSGSSSSSEPLNVIISGQSDPRVLTDDGFLNYAQALGYSHECLGLHLGNPQTANLGDGNGVQNQTTEFREDYRSDSIGTCLESLIGGNHFRVWRQNGTYANSGALFLAVSREMDLSSHHDIVDNGYNVGRDELVGNATSKVMTHNSVKYSTVSKDITGLMNAGNDGINHGIAVDGIVKLLTVTIQ